MRKLHYLPSIILMVMLGTCTQFQQQKQISVTNQLNIDTLDLLTMLPAVVDESSGLILDKGILWTHNDSGGDPVLFGLALEKSEMIANVEISGAGARDWEELARDSTFVYIGDFGNNRGNRKDLVIYKVSLDSLTYGNSQPARAQKIEFSYPDQTDFTKRPYQHNFDCEGMIASGDSLYLFSKNHQNQRCRLYRLPKTPGVHTAELLSEMDTQGLITAADISDDGSIIALLGYNVYQHLGKYRDRPFVWLLTDFPGNRFFEGAAVRVNFAQERQTEGICFGRNGELIISSEGKGSGSGGLFLLDYQKWIK
jgi:hypothetical protein